MLDLDRKPGERVLLGDSIVVTVREVRRGSARLGIEAPPGVVIAREELRRTAAAALAARLALAR